jgi:hypothetical protein
MILYRKLEEIRILWYIFDTKARDEYKEMDRFIQSMSLRVF